MDSLRMTGSVVQPTFLSTFDRESRYPIFITFCECLSIAEIIPLTQTCKSLSRLYQYLLPIQWDVDKALRRYVGDPCGLRSQMAKYDALIAGSFAVQYFERASWEDDRTLDLIVRQGPGSDLLSKHISEVEGYSKVRAIEYGSGEETQEFMRNADSNIVISLIVTQSLPVQYIFKESCTTAGVDIISWNKAYSIFPLPSYIQRKCYSLQDVKESTGNWVRFQHQRGMNVQGVMWPEGQRSNHPIRERRRVGDRYTWMIPFDTRKVEWSKTPDYVLEHACFQINSQSVNYNDNDNVFYHYGMEDARNYTLTARVLESKVLKHTYTYGGEAMIKFLLPRLHSSTVFELRRLSPRQRPANYNQIMQDRGDVENADVEFDRPASWTYRDDEFPAWYQAFEKFSPE